MCSTIWFDGRTPTARARPSSTAVRELIGERGRTEAVLSFLRKMDVGKVKAGVLGRDAV